METSRSNRPWSTSPEWGRKVKVSKAALDSQITNTAGKSKELQDKYVYCGMSMAVRYRTEGKQKLAKRPMEQGAPTTHGQQVWRKVKK